MNVSFLTALRVFVPFAGGYFLSYLYRVVNAVIAPDLVIDLGIGPSALGLLTSTYFIAFASSQLPLGVLLDRFGPRRVEAFLLLFAGLGAFLFSWSGTLAGLVAARAFIGFGVSACLMAAFKAYTLWFAREKWPLVNGFQMAAGGFGAPGGDGTGGVGALSHRLARPFHGAGRAYPGGGRGGLYRGSRKTVQRSG